jgi:hypothetical protein
MEQIIKALNAIAKAPKETNERNRVSGWTQRGCIIEVVRRFDIDSATLLPIMDVIVYIDEAFVDKCSGVLMDNDEIVKINKLFIEIALGQEKANDVKREMGLTIYNNL